MVSADLPWLDDVVRAKRHNAADRLTREEVRPRSNPCHRDVSTTQIYTHVLNRGPAGVRSPADRLFNA